MSLKENVETVFESDRPLDVGRVADSMEDIERTLKAVQADLARTLGAIQAAREVESSDRRDVVVSAVSAVLGLSWHASASGAIQSQVAGVTAKAGYVQALFETNAVRTRS